VLFLDEPTAGLDPEAARTVRDFIKALKTQGRTVLLCTHNLAEAEQLCDRIAVLKSHLVALDTPEALRSQVFGRKTIIRLRQVTSEIVAALGEIDGVGRVEHQGNRLFLTLENPDQDHPRIVRRLVELGADVQKVAEEKHSLEDTYLNLIQEG
jgi:ABC-2 type transport system ATP-binding protein